jgi:hypothetical protein
MFGERIQAAAPLLGLKASTVSQKKHFFYSTKLSTESELSRPTTLSLSGAARSAPLPRMPWRYAIWDWRWTGEADKTRDPGLPQAPRLSVSRPSQADDYSETENTPWPQLNGSQRRIPTPFRLPLV